MEPVASLAREFEHDFIDNQPASQTGISERYSLDEDDGTDENIPGTSPTTSSKSYLISDDTNIERRLILEQSMDSDMVDTFDGFDTTSTTFGTQHLSTTAASENDDPQTHTMHSTSCLNDVTNQLLQPSTSRTTTTTDGNDCNIDRNLYANSLIENSDHSNQQYLDDTLSQPPQHDDNTDTLSPLFSATPTSSYPITTNLDDRPLNRTTTMGSDEQTLSEPVGPRHEWEADRQASECRRCGRRFNFLIRRHHCRRCGQIVCDRCSSHRVRLPVEEIVEDPLISTSHYPVIAMNPQRVCEACIRIPIKADPSALNINGSYQQHYSVNMQRSNSQQSVMVECPVCGNGLLGLRKEQQEHHLNRCLNTGNPIARPPRYIIYTLMEGAAQIGDECPICFEEFEVRNKIARMVCLCSYHRRCLRNWLERGNGCPIHYDSNVGSY